MAGPISKAFLLALADTFDEAGREAVCRVRDEDPETHASVFAQKAVRNGAETIH